MKVESLSSDVRKSSVDQTMIKFNTMRILFTKISIWGVWLKIYEIDLDLIDSYSFVLSESTNILLPSKNEVWNTESLHLLLCKFFFGHTESVSLHMYLRLCNDCLNYCLISLPSQWAYLIINDKLYLLFACEHILDGAYAWRQHTHLHHYYTPPTPTPTTYHLCTLTPTNPKKPFPLSPHQHQPFSHPYLCHPLPPYICYSPYSPVALRPLYTYP